MYLDRLRVYSIKPLASTEGWEAGEDLSRCETGLTGSKNVGSGIILCEQQKSASPRGDRPRYRQSSAKGAGLKRINPRDRGHGAGASAEEGTVDNGSRRDGKAVPERDLRGIGQDERGRRPIENASYTTRVSSPRYTIPKISVKLSEYETNWSVRFQGRYPVSRFTRSTSYHWNRKASKLLTYGQIS
jgi:hypothetical protein